VSVVNLSGWRAATRRRHERVDLNPSRTLKTRDGMLMLLSLIM
jgi:hypothetical protein